MGLTELTSVSTVICLTSELSLLPSACSGMETCRRMHQFPSCKEYGSVASSIPSFPSFGA